MIMGNRLLLLQSLLQGVAVLITVLTSLISVRGIIRKPAIYAMRGQK